MERAADIVDMLNRIKPRQYVVMELSGRRLVFDFDVPDAGSGDVPTRKPIGED
jgi:hypothetical protein